VSLGTGQCNCPVPPGTRRRKSATKRASFVKNLHKKIQGKLSERSQKMDVEYEFESVLEMEVESSTTIDQQLRIYSLESFVISNPSC
jgi:hypothetical protein